MEIAISDCTNGSTHPMEKNGLPLTPVPPKSTGEGLPYAPVDFPNPGDVWTWKVGNKINSSGYYTHRFLIVPKRFQKTPSRKIWLGSKAAAAQYIQSEFPDADVDVFFSMFTWEIRAETRKDKKRPSRKATPLKKIKSRSPISRNTPLKVVKSSSRISQRTALKELESSSPISRKTSSKEVEPISQKTSLKEIESGSQLSRRTRSSAKKSKLSTADEDTTTSMDIQLPEGTSADDNLSPNKRSKRNNNNNNNIDASPMKTMADQSDVPPLPQGSSSLADYLAEMTQEDFEFYLNSLDDILYDPVPRALNPGPIRPLADDVSKARLELSSLLSTGITSLVNSDKLSKIMTLSSTLQFDPYLSPQEISTLNLIEEIPTVQEDFLEAQRITSEATKFFSELEEKKAHVEERKNEFIQSKGTIAFLQAEEGSASSTIREIDEQMALLRSRRAVLAKVVETNKKKIAELCSKQKQAFDSVPKIVNEVQMAKSEKPLWEMRQKEAARKEEEILTKFAPLQGFSFLR